VVTVASGLSSFVQRRRAFWSRRTSSFPP
jgi:hypothetical protein